MQFAWIQGHLNTAAIRSFQWRTRSATAERITETVALDFRGQTSAIFCSRNFLTKRGGTRREFVLSYIGAETGRQIAGGHLFPVEFEDRDRLKVW